MIKIRLLERDIHRNETTFRPFLDTYNLFKEVGIEFTDSDDYDYAWVGQASIIDKKKSLKESIEKGLEFVSKITGDYFIVDGQDAITLIGTVDVFRESNALLFLKNSYLKDFDLYKKGWANGRYYWGEGNYSVDDIDNLKSKMKLTGCNWLSTVKPNWLQYNSEKQYDISCMFGYPTDPPVYEHDLCQTEYYDEHRRKLLEELSLSKYKNLKIAKLIDGKRIPKDKYYQMMYNSKIIMAPLGYGSMAPRDIESAMFGSVLVKPDVSFIDSKPFIYEDNVTYVAVKYDWTDLQEKIDYVLSDYSKLQNYYVENMRESYNKKYNKHDFVKYIYNIFLNLSGVEKE